MCPDCACPVWASTRWSVFLKSPKPFIYQPTHCRKKLNQNQHFLRWGAGWCCHVASQEVRALVGAVRAKKLFLTLISLSLHVASRTSVLSSVQTSAGQRSAAEAKCIIWKEVGESNSVCVWECFIPWNTVDCVNTFCLLKLFEALVWFLLKVLLSMSVFTGRYHKYLRVLCVCGRIVRYGDC